MQIGEEIGDPGSTLAVLSEVVGRAQDGGVAFDEGEAGVVQEFLGAELAIEFIEFGLVVEEIELGRGSRHVEVNNPFGLGRKMGTSRSDLGRDGALSILGEEHAECGCADPGSRALEEVSSGESAHMFHLGIHNGI